MKVKKPLMWSRLKNNECPKCKEVLRSSDLAGVFECAGDGCDFTISEIKFTKIVTDLYKPQNKREIDYSDNNLSDLNDLDLIERFHVVVDLNDLDLESESEGFLADEDLEDLLE